MLESSQPLHDLTTLATWADAQQLVIEDLDVRKPSLEDVYLQLTASE